VRELVEFVAKSLVDHPDDVRTRTHERTDQTIIELEVAQEDLGKIIGRQGRTARAIRTLLNAAGQKSRRRFSLDILD
jgi:predicted RNA-binding protein YlqC (UPF0109 family)